MTNLKIYQTQKQQHTKNIYEQHKHTLNINTIKSNQYIYICNIGQRQTTQNTIHSLIHRITHKHDNTVPPSPHNYKTYTLHKHKKQYEHIKQISN